MERVNGEVFAELPLRLDFSPPLTLEQLRSKVFRAQKLGQCDVLFVDYTGLMRMEQQKMDQEFALKKEQMEREFALKREQMAAEMQLKREQAAADTAIKQQQAREQAMAQRVAAVEQARNTPKPTEGAQNG